MAKRLKIETRGNSGVLAALEFQAIAGRNPKLMVGWISVIAELMYVAYKSADAADGIADWLKDLKDGVDHIISRLRELENKVDEVYYELRLLVDAVKGRIDRNFFLANMGEMESAIFNILPYLRDELTIAANADMVESELDRLSRALTGMLGDSTLTSTINAIGGVATWVKAHNLTQKLRDPGTRVWVWEHPFHMSFLAKLDEIATIADTETQRVKTDLGRLGMPGSPQRIYWTLQLDRFAGVAKIQADPFPPFPGDIIWAPREARQATLFCSPAYSPNDLYATIPRAGGQLGLTHEYRNVTEALPWERPNDVGDAFRIFRSGLALREQLTAHNQLVPQFKAARDQIAAAAARPANWPQN